MTPPGSGSRLEVLTTSDGGFAVHVRRADTCRIHVGAGLAERLGALLKPLVGDLDAPRIVIAADAGARHHLPAVTSAVQDAGVPVALAMLPAGETTKGTEGLRQLWQALHQAGAARRTLVLVLGGGALCDLATVAVATYMRGLPYVLVPTTVLAQLDAAIGGKGGINFLGAKNLLGAFHHPLAVFIDPTLTRTLPERQVRNGFAEAIKVALIADPDLFTTLEQASTRPLEELDLTGIIRTAVGAKLALLAPDPFEQDDLRRLLNLGHCIGHPLEAATGYHMLHGEAVAAGIAAASAVAHRDGHCTRTNRDRILALLAGHHLPTSIPAPLRAPVWERLETIRRIRNGPLNLVLPHRPGYCTVRADITRYAFDAALADLDTAQETRP